VAEQVGFFDDHDGGSATFVAFGGECVGSLGGQRGVMGQRLSAQGGDDAVVDTAHPDGGVGQVDDGVAAAVESVECGAYGDGFAGADLAGDHPDAPFGHAPADAGDRFVVRGVSVQHGWGQVAAERHPGKPVVGGQFVDHRCTSCRCASCSVSRSSWPGIWSVAPVRAA